MCLYMCVSMHTRKCFLIVSSAFLTLFFFDLMTQSIGLHCSFEKGDQLVFIKKLDGTCIWFCKWGKRATFYMVVE